MNQNDAGKLAGRVVVVTGGASGIGEAASLRLLEDGACVVVGDVDRDGAARLAETVQRRYGRLDRFGFESCDVSQEFDVVNLLRYTMERFGRLDCMVNNAATGGAFGSLLETSVENWDRTQGVNLRGAFLGTKHAAKLMIDQGRGGSIINVSSIAAESGGAAGAAYSASKAGVVALTRCAAVQLGKHNIRCNAIIPGAIVSPLTHRNIDPEGMMEIAAGMQPLPIAGVPELIAPSFAFLASDDSQFISGTMLFVDGGGSAMGMNLYSGTHPFGNAIVERASQAGVGAFDFGVRAGGAAKADSRVLEELRPIREEETARRCILVTGVSRGLGRALCRELARLGHVVVGCARSAESVAAIRAELGPPHRVDQLDVTDDAAVTAWAQDLVAAGLVPDLVLNNAAVANEGKQAWRFDRDEIDRLLQVNVHGIFNVLRAFIPDMIRRKRGIVVNFSSGWGREAAAKVAPYCASKWAVEGMTKAMSYELPPTMGVVSLHPGIIQTDTLQTSFGESAALYPKPDEWARVAVPFLLRITPADNGRQLSVPGMTTFRGMGRIPQPQTAVSPSTASPQEKVFS
jgi:NAD(P)-dependent dehydrogenase (short-subunit alcohol dehydrogenase family)